MSLAGIGVLVVAVAAASSVLAPVAQAAPQVSSGLSFTAVSPTRLHDTRVPGDRIAARGNVSFTVPPVSDDAVAVLVNVAGTNPDGPTFRSVQQSGGVFTATPTVNLRAGETPSHPTAPCGDGAGANTRTRTTPRCGCRA